MKWFVKRLLLEHFCYSFCKLKMFAAIVPFFVYLFSVEYHIVFIFRLCLRPFMMHLIQFYQVHSIIPLFFLSILSQKKAKQANEREFKYQVSRQSVNCSVFFYVHVPLIPLHFICTYTPSTSHKHHVRTSMCLCVCVCIIIIRNANNSIV